MTQRAGEFSSISSSFWLVIGIDAIQKRADESTRLFLFVRAARLVCHQICGEESKKIIFCIVFSGLIYGTYLDIKYSGSF